MVQPRNFLFLQGPMGPFFKKLAARLRDQGHHTLRVNFNGGDALHFCSSHAVDFTGTLAVWPEWVRGIAERHNITDVVLYGDCRPLHRAAIEVLKPMGVEVHAFEEGYFRPYWVTLETGGVNAHSSLPRDPAVYHAHAEAHNVLDDKLQSLPLGASLRHLARYTMSYYAACAFLKGRYRNYHTHRVQNYQIEGLGWLWRLMTLPLRNRAAMQYQQRVMAASPRYFLVILQLMGDSQITHHSPYHDMYEFLNDVLQDFAANAPSETALVVKNHPLDNGLSRYGAFLAQKARSLGLEGRLHYIDGGHLPTLLEGAAGAVTVNSTAGLSAVHHGIPTHLGGDAIYAMEGLVDTQPLAQFWHSPKAPDKNLYFAFRHYVMQHTQVNGCFYTRLGVRTAIKHTLRRFKACKIPADCA